MDQEQLNRLPAETFVRAIEWHEQLGSTSDRAIELAALNAQPLPLLVIARRQTAGRGRGENRWWSAPGALTFSLVIDGFGLGVSQDRWPRLSLATALVVGDAIRQQVPQADVQLKWPNDVYIAGRKVCGILVEVPGAAPGRVVIGAGLNVNNSLAAAPAEIQDSAVALCDVARRELDLTAILKSILRGLETEMSRLGRDELCLARRWQPYCLLEGETITLRQGNHQHTGICDSIDEDGALLLRTRQGTERFISGSVVAWTSNH
jgi:BirA family biotin operon repressor/biotin-[acetyl-CoA-carboxylase] ligase